MAKSSAPVKVRFFPASGTPSDAFVSDIASIKHLLDDDDMFLEFKSIHPQIWDNAGDKSVSLRLCFNEEPSTKDSVNVNIPSLRGNALAVIMGCDGDCDHFFDYDRGYSSHDVDSMVRMWAEIQSVNVQIMRLTPRGVLLGASFFEGMKKNNKAWQRAVSTVVDLNARMQAMIMPSTAAASLFADM